MHKSSNIGFFIVGLNLTITVYYQAIEVPKYSNWLCIFRSVIFLPISVVILGFLWGINGIWLSLLASELLSLLSSACMAYVPNYTMKYVAE